MPNDFVPAQDGPALNWMEHFVDGLAASPGTYAVSQPDLDNLRDVIGEYAEGFRLATGETTRTKVTINDKDQARAVAEQLCRSFAKRIKANDGIPDSAKIAVGVRPENNGRQPIYAPASSPLLNVVGATPGAQTLRYADSATPNSGRKPFGAAQIELYVAVLDEPTADEGAARFIGNFTRNPIAVEFAHEDDGKVATYFARWGGRRGDAGPWSLPVAMRVVA